MTPVEKYNYYQETMQKARENGEYGTNLFLRKKLRSCTLLFMEKMQVKPYANTIQENPHLN